MTWRPDLWGGCEAAKIAPFVVPYLQGRCLDIGSGPGKVWPGLIGIDRQAQGAHPVTDIRGDGTDLSMFADETFDGVFSSFMLSEQPREKVPAILTEWARVLKIGGHLVLYLPHGIPEDADPVPVWQADPCWIKDRLREIDGWVLVECEVREDGDEYGLMLVARRTEGGWIENIRQRNPGGMKRALVVRMGAIGDAIVAASILPLLKKQGYHVTFNAHPSTKDVLMHDPHIDEWMLQDRDFVPNDMLGPYWKMLETRYDKVINLCESVEGQLLALVGRLNHGFSDEARRALYSNVNYQERTHDIAGLPHEFSGKFYMTPSELEKARWDRRKMNGPVVVWCVNGSSPHKVYPWVPVVAGWLLKRTPAHIVLYSDPGIGQQLTDAIVERLTADGCDMSRVHGIGGKWDLRRALTFAHVADCVVGPETGPLNVVGMDVTVAKVIYMSHSSPANLTKHWKNTITLSPDAARAPCWPCHRLHSTWEYCHQDEKTNAALCASSIAPERVFEAIALKLGAQRLAA